jgi:ElaA protein
VPAPRVLRAPLGELDPATLYAILRLRVDVFVVEQRCPYPELDGRDVEPDAVHWWVEEDGGVLACLRVLREAQGHRVGRVVTRRAARGRGLAALLLRAALEDLERPVVLDAQDQQVAWYGRFGFEVDGPGFVEDGIPHTPMRLRERQR